jgi:hypothetical protein
MKRALYFGLILVGLFGIFLARIYTFNHQQLTKEYLAMLAGNKFEITTGKISPLKISFKPYMEIKNIHIKDTGVTDTDNEIFLADRVKVEFNLFDLFLGKKKFDTIKLTAPTLNVLSAQAVQGYVDYLQQHTTIIKEINVKDGRVCDLVTKDCEKYITKFDLSFNDKKSARTLNLNWGVAQEDKFNLTATLQKDSTIKAVINGQSGKFTLNGKVENSQIQGNIAAEVYYPNLVLKQLVKPFELPRNLNIANTKTNIIADAQILLGLGKLQVNNIKFDSTDVKGTGNVSYLSGEAAKININFYKFVSTNVLNPAENSNTEQNTFLEESFTNVDEKLALTKLSDKETSINFKELVLGDKRFTDLVINYAIKDGAVYTANVDGVYNEDLRFSLKNPNYDLNEKILISDLSLNGKNLASALSLFTDKKSLEYHDKEALFSLNSKLKLSPTEFNLNEIEFKVAEATISGSLKKTLGVNSEYSGSINFSNFEFGKLSSDSFKEIVKYFYFNSNESGYLAKFKILRDLKEKLKFEIKIDNSAIDNLQIREMTSEIAIEKGQLKINRLAIDSDFAKIDKLAFAIDARALNPNINLDTTATKLDLDYIKNMFGLVSEEAKTPEVKQTNENLKSVWSSENLKYFRFDKFLGSIKLDLNNVNIQGHIVDKILLASKLRDETLFIEPLQLKINDGSLDIKGAISNDYDQTIISINFNAANIDLTSLASYIDVKRIKGGKTNFYGNIYTTGANAATLINNLTLTVPFAIRDLSLEGFNLQDLILKSAGAHFNSAIEVKDFLNKAFSSSILDLASVNGLLKISKGLIESKDVTFKTAYSAGVFGGVLDLNKMVLKSQSNITFIPEQQAKPIVIAISNYGNLKNIDTSVNYDLLEQYLTSKITPPAGSEISLENKQ